MTDLHGALARLSRPRLLIRAARFGLAEYRRTPGLRRALAAVGAHAPAQVVAHLMRREDELDRQRRAGDAAYSVARHVEVLIALMGEAQHLPQHPPLPEARRGRGVAPQPKASGISALRRVANASSASRVAGSSGGAS
ncbi:DUF6477 family protein [Rhodobaculum claviforme]|uniref:DUF6477 family protein n=1 Tax=Rhodobaculum claviforme TaxID=1549854 RepID=UPI001912CC23|nr:DUF6477 family protein [Rhodobaculum claviforme]